MKKNNRISDEALQKLDELAELTKNYTGAEIEGLVRNAASYAFSRNVNVQDLAKADASTFKVEWVDFQRALSETIPAFGNKDALELSTLYRNGIIPYGPAFDDIWNTMLKLVNQSRHSTKTPLLTVLLEGPSGTGKTALAARMAQDSGFPLVRLLSADSMIGLSESQKCQVIQKAFIDAYKSALSIVFIDDLELIMEYTPVGPRFSNIVLQTLIVFLKKVPTNPDRRLLVVATTSSAEFLESLNLTQVFNVALHVGMLQRPDEIAAVLRSSYAIDNAAGGPTLSEEEIQNIASAMNSPIGIKKLLMIMEMVNASGDPVDSLHFLECLHTCGY